MAYIQKSIKLGELGSNLDEVLQYTCGNLGRRARSATLNFQEGKVKMYAGRLPKRFVLKANLNLSQDQLNRFYSSIPNLYSSGIFEGDFYEEDNKQYISKKGSEISISIFDTVDGKDTELLICYFPGLVSTDLTGKRMEIKRGDVKSFVREPIINFRAPRELDGYAIVNNYRISENIEEEARRKMELAKKMGFDFTFRSMSGNPHYSLVCAVPEQIELADLGRHLMEDLKGSSEFLIEDWNYIRDKDKFRGTGCTTKIRQVGDNLMLRIFAHPEYSYDLRNNSIGILSNMGIQWDPNLSAYVEERKIIPVRQKPEKEKKEPNPMVTKLVAGLGVATGALVAGFMFPSHRLASYLDERQRRKEAEKKAMIDFLDEEKIGPNSSRLESCILQIDKKGILEQSKDKISKQLEETKKSS